MPWTSPNDIIKGTKGGGKMTEKWDFFDEETPDLEIQKDKMKEVWNNKTDKAWETLLTPKRKTIKQNKEIIIDFNDLIQFCREHKGDVECEQFLRHCDPRFVKRRNGGGWSGAVKATINIIRKMEELKYDV